MRSVKIIAVFFMFVLGLVLSSCFNSTASNNQISGYFTDYTKEFVKYDSSVDDIKKAGNYWRMTSKKDQDITIYLKINTDDVYSTVYFYLNDVQIPSERDTDIYDYAYILNLKKGDKLVIHAFWAFAGMYDEAGFKMSYFIVKSSAGTYPISDF